MRSLRSVCLAVAALLIVAGCGGDDPGPERLRYAYGFSPVAALSPYSDDAATTYGIGATESLVFLDPDGTAKPRLAESWTQINSTTWNFVIRDGVRFHDGTAMTARAVADSLTHAVKAEPQPRALTGIEMSVAVVDDKTVAITTKEPDPVLVSRMSSPELVILAEGAYSNPNQPSPVGMGTGPYQITKLDGTSGATLAAFDDYWGGDPGFEGVDVSFVADGDSRSSALKAGQVDVAFSLPASKLRTFSADELIAVPLPSTVALHLTQSSPVFSDPGARETARAAIDELDFAATVYDGFADDADGLFAPKVSTWAANRPATRFPNSTAVKGKSVSLATFSNRPEMSEMATVIADTWRSVGLDVKVTVGDYDQLEGDFLSGKFDAVIMSRSYGYDNPDPIGYLQSDFGCAGSYNISRFCDRTIDADLADAATKTDAAARYRVAVDVEHRLLSTVAVIPLIHDRTQFGIGKGLTGLAEDPWERAVITVDTKFD